MEASWNAIKNMPNNSYQYIGKNDLSYFNMELTRAYHLDIFKSKPNNPTNVLKCAEVSISATPTFDGNSFLFDNSSASFFTSSAFALNIDSIIITGKKYFVVREKECANCNFQISLDTQNSRLNHCPTSPGLVKLDLVGFPSGTTSFGPFEIYRINLDGSSTLVTNALFYNSAVGWNPASFAPRSSGSTEYIFRLRDNWYCKPTTDMSFTITANNCN